MFFSTFPYVFRHITEGHLAQSITDPGSLYARALAGQVEHPTWPCFKTLHAARDCLAGGEELTFYELGATLIHQARCRAAGEFLRSGADIWVSCDEDLEAGRAALETLIEHVEETKGVAFAAYRLRGDTKWSVGIPARMVATDSTTVAGIPHDFDGGAGAGLFVAHRAAIVNATRDWVEEPDDTLSPLLFEAMAIPNRGPHYRWQGEDVTFCWKLTAAEQPMHVFFFPDVTHDGIPNAKHLVP